MFDGTVVTVPAGGTVTAGTVVTSAPQLVHPAGCTSSPSTVAAPCKRTLPAAVMAPFGSIVGYAIRTKALVCLRDSRLLLPMFAWPSATTQNELSVNLVTLTHAVSPDAT